MNRNGGYHTLNYGKKSINLNIKTPRGKELAYELIKRSDFVLECYPTPLSRRVGLSYEDLRTGKATREEHRAIPAAHGPTTRSAPRSCFICSPRCAIAIAPAKASGWTRAWARP